MTYKFDAPVERRGTDSTKWQKYGDDVLPLWVADMDFRAPEPVIQALHRRVEQGVFGYAPESDELRAVIAGRMQGRYGWRIAPEDVAFAPGIVSAFNIGFRAFGGKGDGVVLSTPIYFPMLSGIRTAKRALNNAELRRIEDGHLLRYEIDFDALEAAITPRTRLFMLCNPHNPVGRAYTRAELERIAEICLRHNLIICADEIHSDLILDGRHTPVASLAPEIAKRTITLVAPSKTFNLPGLGCGVVIAQNPKLLARYRKVAEGIVPHPNVLGYTAAIAAYREGQAWLDELLDYLRGNREALVCYVRDELPGVRVTRPEGTYLAWLDFRALNLPEAPSAYLLKHAKVALNDGADFGAGGEGFARLNLGCTRATLLEALARIQAALAEARV